MRWKGSTLFFSFKIVLMKHFKFETNLLNKIYIFLWDKHHLSCFCISVKFVTRLKFYIFSMDINRKVRYIHFWWITLIIPSSVVHLLVHPNHWNIISGTGSCTWPVNFDQPVHPITLLKKPYARQAFAFESADLISITVILTLMKPADYNRAHFLHL